MESSYCREAVTIYLELQPTVVGLDVFLFHVIHGVVGSGSEPLLEESRDILCVLTLCRLGHTAESSTSMR
jgi:hypothetical protein